MKFSDSFDIKCLPDVDCMPNLCYNLPVFHSRGDCMKKYPGMRKLYFQQKWSIEEAQKKADEFRSQFSAIDLGVEIGNGSPAFILWSCQEKFSPGMQGFGIGMQGYATVEQGVSMQRAL